MASSLPVGIAECEGACGCYGVSCVVGGGGFACVGLMGLGPGRGGVGAEGVCGGVGHGGVGEGLA